MGLLADRIRSARKAAGYTSQDAFAAALDVDRKTPQRWEAGRNVPSLAALRAIAVKTGYPIDFFLSAMAEDEEEELVSKANLELSHAIAVYVRHEIRRALIEERAARRQAAEAVA
jgi:transcriptional regulator with XRE-family HTH domain